MSRCVGCGAILQSVDQNAAGYIPPSSEAEGKLYCKRCYQIRNHNYDYSLDNYQILTNPEQLTKYHHQYFNHLNEIRENNTLVLLIVDCLDIHNGFIPNIKAIVKNMPLWVIVNKIDLMPKAFKINKFEEYLKRDAKELGLDLRNVLFISASKLANVDLVIKRIKEAINKKGFNKTQVFVIGTTSVGKSTFINQIIKSYGDHSADGIITTSLVSNTTKDNIYINIGKNYQCTDTFIIDTPGYLNGSNLRSYLSLDNLKKIEPKALKPMTYQLTSDQSFLLDKIASLDITLRSEHASVTFYMSNALYFHRTKLINKERAKAVLATSSVLNLSDVEKRIIEDQKELTFEVTKPTYLWLSGLGFIQIVGDVAIKLSVPQIMKVVQDEIL